MTELQKRLYELQDEGYLKFNRTIVPGVSRMIGVRTPELRKLAKELSKSDKLDEFLRSLPHEYYEENQIHAAVISEMKDMDKCLWELERFLPYVDNWATCDGMHPKVFAKHHEPMLERVRYWIKSEHTYTCRFAIDMLMTYLLDRDFDEEYADMVADVHSEEYYVNMMRAWYFATALAKQYERILPYIQEKRLDTWTHNKTIQKAVESFRISDEQKKYLKTLKIK